MNKRPISVTVISWLFIAAGVVGLVYHSTELNLAGGVQPETIWVLALRLLAVLCGIFMLRGHNWARWVLLAWIAYHVVLSAFHSPAEFAMHAALLVIVAWFLLRKRAAEYFHS